MAYLLYMFALWASRYYTSKPKKYVLSPEGLLAVWSPGMSVALCVEHVPRVEWHGSRTMLFYIQTSQSQVSLVWFGRVFSSFFLLLLVFNRSSMQKSHQAHRLHEGPQATRTQPQDKRGQKVLCLGEEAGPLSK